MNHSSCSNSSSDASTTMKNSHLELVNSYLLALCGIILSTWCIQWVWKRRYLYIHSWNVPGPLALPFIGAGYVFISRKNNIMETVLELQKYYPETFVLWIGTKLNYSVSKPEHIKKILTSSKALDKSDLYDFVSCIIGEGLLTAKAPKWKKDRKIIMPAFNQKILNAYQKIFVRQGEVFADQLQKNIGNEEMDLSKLVLNCTIDIICETALGLNMNIQTSDSNFREVFDRGMEITLYRICHIWHHLKFTWNWYPLSKEYNELIKTFKDFTEVVINKRLEAYNDKQNSKYTGTLTKEKDHSSCSNSSSDASTTMKNFHLKLVNSYLFALCGIILLTWCIQWVWKRRYLYIHSWNVPGPFALPFIGAAYLFISRKRDIMEIVLKLQEYYPETFVLWLGTQLSYFVSKPEHIKKILTSSKALNKNELYDFASFVIGEGLLTAKAPKWKKHRKIIMTAFNQKILNAYQKIFVRKGEVFADQLQKNIGNQEMDLHELVSNCTLDIICETALGLNMNIQTSNTDFCKTLERGMEITLYRMSHIWHYLKFTWNWYPLSEEYDKLMKKFKDFTEEVIKKKLDAYNNKQNSKYSTPLTKEEESSEEVAFLDLILENNNFTELELREEVDLFVIAGSDTTASAVSCTFTMLGMLPDVQQKVLEEILEIVGPDRKVLPYDLPEMKYTERVIKESLRLFPVAPFFARSISEDIDAGDKQHSLLKSQK